MIRQRVRVVIPQSKEYHDTSNIVRRTQDQKRHDYFTRWALKVGGILLLLIFLSNRFEDSSNDDMMILPKRPKGDFRQPRVLRLDERFQVQHLQESPDQKIVRSKRQRLNQFHLSNNKQYQKWQRDPHREGDCEPMVPWQETSFPSCNKWHEIHMTNLQVLTEGGYNTIFTLQDMDGSTLLAKILKYQREYSDRDYDRVRQDSLLQQEATSASDHVIETYYSYCGFSQILEYDPAGTLQDFLMRYSLSFEQVTFLHGRFQRSDLDRGRFFLRWKNPPERQEEPCPYTIGNNGDKLRAPQDYVQRGPPTTAIDVWALGSIFVELVSGLPVWHGYYNWDARAAIQEGIRLRHERDHQILLLHAIDMCWVYKEAKDRPRVGIALEYLKKESTRLGRSHEISN